MKILVVDDLRTLAIEQGQHDVVHARTVNKAIDLLESGVKWDVIFLDHDMGGDDTTIPVARWIRKKVSQREDPEDFDPNIYIHTMNPVGRRNLKLELMGCNHRDIYL
jgi:CheY-like chemotaxis protein